MRRLSVFFFLIFVTGHAGADNPAPTEPIPAPGVLNPSCDPDLAPKAKRFSSGEMITRLLEERGAALGATNIGLFEIWTKNGENIISRIYFTTDGSDPITQEQQKEFMDRFSKRTHQVTRINAWKLNLVRGGSVIHSVPVR